MALNQPKIGQFLISPLPYYWEKEDDQSWTCWTFNRSEINCAGTAVEQSEKAEKKKKGSIMRFSFSREYVRLGLWIVVNYQYLIHETITVSSPV
jgi:hypothetical protein